MSWESTQTLGETSSPSVPSAHLLAWVAVKELNLSYYIG